MDVWWSCCSLKVTWYEWLRVYERLVGCSDCVLIGGENEEDTSTMVYYLNSDENRWELKSEQMISGITETTIHSSYAVINIDMDLDWTLSNALFWYTHLCIGCLVTHWASAIFWHSYLGTASVVLVCWYSWACHINLGRWRNVSTLVMVLIQPICTSGIFSHQKSEVTTADHEIHCQLVSDSTAYQMKWLVRYPRHWYISYISVMGNYQNGP